MSAEVDKTRGIAFGNVSENEPIEDTVQKDVYYSKGFTAGQTNHQFGSGLDLPQNFAENARLRMFFHQYVRGFMRAKLKDITPNSEVN